MALSFTGRKRIRKSFGKIPEVTKMPNLIEVQKSSYDQFLQMHIMPEERGDDGLNGVFRSVFPIKDFSETAELHYVRYELEEPKYDVEECQQRGMTYAAPPYRQSPGGSDISQIASGADAGDDLLSGCRTAGCPRSEVCAA